MLPHLTHTQMLRRFSVVLVIVLGTMGTLIACASSGGVQTARRPDCGMRDQDSVFAVRGPVFRECNVDVQARLTNTDVHPDFRPTQTGTKCYSAEVEFVVDAKGEVETKTARVLRATDDALGESVIAMLPKLHFEPAMRDGQPVRQIATQKSALQTAVMVSPAGAGRPPAPPRGTVGKPSC